MALTQITTDGIKDGTITGTDLTTNVDFVDNQKLRLGTGNDLEIYHDGSHSYIKDTGTGRLILQSSQLCLQSTTGENFLVGNPDAGTELYHNNVKKFETTSTGVSVTGAINSTGSLTISSATPQIFLTDTNNNSDYKVYAENGTFHIMDVTNSENRFRLESDGDFDLKGNVRIPLDNKKLQIGAGQDLEIYHDGTDSIINTITGSLLYQYNGTTVALQTDTRLGFQDNKKASFGTGNDLEIYHSSGDSYITNSDGNLNIVNSTDGWIRLQPKSGEEGVIVKYDGAVELYYDNVKRFATISNGAQVEGSLYLSDNSNMHYSDTNKAAFGNSSDLQIYHDGSNSYFKNAGTGNIIFLSDDVQFKSDGGGNTGLTINTDGAVELYHNNSKKFETTSGGAKVTGFLNVTTGIHIPDGGDNDNSITIGSSNDLRLFHDGSNSFIKNSTGGLDLNSDTIHLRNGANSETYARFLANGAAELYYDNSKKFQTHSNGVLIYNAIVIDNELNLQSFSDGVARTKYMDIGYAGNTMNFRRTNANDGAHATVMTMNNSLVISGDFHDTSDAKLKKNIKSIADGAMAVIKKLRPVTFDWIDETRRDNVSGFIAQEVLTVLPDLVDGTEYDPTLNDEAKGTKGGIKSDGYSVNSVGITAHLTKALQEAIAKIEALETEVAALKAG